MSDPKPSSFAERVGALGFATDLFAFSADPDTQEGGRIGGWVLFSTFAASAVYGGYVMIERQSSGPSAAPSKPGSWRP